MNTIKSIGIGLLCLLIGGIIGHFIFPGKIILPGIDHYVTNTQIQYVYKNIPGPDVYPQDPAEVSNQYNKLTNYQSSPILMSVQEAPFSYKVDASHVDVKSQIKFKKQDYTLTAGVGFPPIAFINARIYQNYGAFVYAGWDFKEGYYGGGISYSFSLSEIFENIRTNNP